jgi:hypothetical protein
VTAEESLSAVASVPVMNYLPPTRSVRIPMHHCTHSHSRQIPGSFLFPQFFSPSVIALLEKLAAMQELGWFSIVSVSS